MGRYSYLLVRVCVTSDMLIVLGDILILLIAQRAIKRSESGHYLLLDSFFLRHGGLHRSKQ